MSYDIRVVRKVDGKYEDVFLKSNHLVMGGTYCAGGTDFAWFNITYNYSKFFYAQWPKKNEDDDTAGIRHLYGLPLRESIKCLKDAIAKMSGEPDEDYWAATEGNAKKSLVDLLSLCEIAIKDYPEDDLYLFGD